MATTVAAMPSSISSVSTDRRADSEAGPSGFTAVNGSTPPSRESSATSPDVSPKHGNTSIGRQTPANGVLGNGFEPHKRKRSMSSEHNAHSPRRYDYHPPRSDSQQRMADKALHVLGDATAPSSHYYSNTPNGPDRSSYTYERPYANTNGATPTTATPENRLVEAFQHDHGERHGYAPSMEGSLHETPEHHRMEDGESPLVQQTGQKRKRNFSNRTKTGCLTCRHRKKKCDEGRPICNNCVRGGFQCAGYNNSRQGNTTWTKPPSSAQPKPLQSKEDDHDHWGDNSHDNVSPATYNARQPSSADGSDQSRPCAAESRPPYSSGHQGGPQWSQHAQQPQQGQMSSAQPYGADHLPPFSELTRPESQSRQEYSQTPSREMSRPPTHSNPPSGAPHSASAAPPSWQQVPSAHQQPQPSQAQSHSEREYRSSQYPPRINTQQPGPPARIPSATSYNMGSSTKNFTAEEVERSKMMRGAAYNYLDATLKNERQRAGAALKRFNFCHDLDSGLDERQARDLLLKVLNPFEDTNHSFRAPCKEAGILGPGVVIEQGFRCTYGYNLRIMDNVFIGEHTRIDDSGKVDIGARTWICADVSILTNEPVKDFSGRMGTDGQMCVAKGVSIGASVHIGTGAVIYPGIKIGTGATIEPYAVVKQDVQEHATMKATFMHQMRATGSGGVGGGMLS